MMTLYSNQLDHCDSTHHCKATYLWIRYSSKTVRTFWAGAHSEENIAAATGLVGIANLNVLGNREGRIVRWRIVRVVFIILVYLLLLFLWTGGTLLFCELWACFALLCFDWILWSVSVRFGKHRFRVLARRILKIACCVVLVGVFMLAFWIDLWEAFSRRPLLHRVLACLAFLCQWKEVFHGTTPSQCGTVINPVRIVVVR